MSEAEAKSSKTVVMPAMMTDTTTLEKEMANMKAILEKLTRESVGKEARIKFQEEKIAKLTRKLEIKLANLLQRTHRVWTLEKCQSTLRLLTMRSNQRKWYT